MVIVVTYRNLFYNALIYMNLWVIGQKVLLF